MIFFDSFTQFVSRIAPRVKKHLFPLPMRKIFYLPKITSKPEMRMIIFLAGLCVLTGLLLVSRIYLGITTPIPGIGGTYTEGMIGDPRTINPIYAVRDTDRDLSRLLFAGLMTYDSAGNIVPDLADHINISNDAKIYTIALKNNLFWHDGEPITADDIIFTVHAIQNSQFRSPLRSDWQGVSVEKISDTSVRFFLRIPYTPFKENLTLGILPKHIWQAVTPDQAFLHEANLKPVGSGPYRFDQMKQNKDGSFSRYQVVRNVHYHRQGPFIEKIVFQFFKNEDEEYGAWRRGIIDGYGGVSPLHYSEMSAGKSVVYSLTMPRVFGIFFNPKHASLLEDMALRQAIAYAIDRNEIVQHQKQNKALPVDGPLPWITSASSTPLYPFDLDQSRTLLKKAGWKDADGDGLLEKTVIKKVSGKNQTTILPLRFTLTTSDWPDLIETAVILQNQLRRVGIEVIIEKKSFQDLESTIIRPRNFEVLLFGQVYGYEPDPFAFWHSTQIKDPGLNITFFSDKKVDKILEDIRSTSDAAARANDYQIFSRILSQQLPAVFLYSQDYLYTLPKDIRGASLMRISLPSDRFNDVNAWYRVVSRHFIWGK